MLKSELLDKLKTKASVWYDANAAKNAANNVEMKAKKDLQTLTADLTEPVEVAVTNNVTLKIGDQQFDDWEVDAKKLLQTNPDAFWEFVGFNITDLKAHLGDKEYQKMLRPTKVTRFKIEKIKKV